MAISDIVSGCALEFVVVMYVAQKRCRIACLVPLIDFGIGGCFTKQRLRNGVHRSWVVTSVRQDMFRDVHNFSKHIVGT